LDQSLPSWNTAVNQIANNMDTYTYTAPVSQTPGEHTLDHLTPITHSSEPSATGDGVIQMQD
jgi:hypothetical protein